MALHSNSLLALDFYEKHPAPEKIPRPAVQLPPSMLSGNATAETQPKKSEVSLGLVYDTQSFLAIRYDFYTLSGNKP